MLTSDPAVAPAAAVAPADVAAPSRVIVVDDTPDLRNLLRLMLTRGGFDVVGEAADGRAGIEVARRTRPDVVLLDIAMPVMDGLEALPSLRRSLPEARIIAMSAFGATQMAARAVAAGADGYIQKGTSLHAILAYVRELSGLSDRPSSPVAVSQEGALTDATARPVRSAPQAGDRDGAGPSRDEAFRLAVQHAPYGVLEVTDEPSPRVREANPVARRLLGGNPATGSLLSMTAPGLAHHVSTHRHEPDAVFEALVDAGTVRATLRRVGSTLLVYLDSTAEDVGLLRRAIATAAHELRGPIAVIDGAVEAVSWGRDSLSGDDREDLLQSVKRQVAQLDRVTADLFTATQVHRGTLHVDLHDVDLGALVTELLGDRSDVALRIEEAPAVRADALRLEQMLGNLLSNAHRYGAAPFEVVVRGDGGGRTVRVEVVDRGPGVAEDFEPHLFREFSRPEGSVATGTGLGLYVVRTLAEAMGGAATYRRHPEGGAVFTVQLPVA
ncbi:hybrid sensor histidine kinase/response regulator [Nocardioides zeae]|uniref:histidine kinase n=1 Tax=Nocardioides imazamoxiresistens TaxID=3231893 RepID=A0ABU3Q1J8_9ACTN|nr:hybrid sensor histidine kinase/response regulator [Nocardioides zeae]MDT9595321.1 hybrid sensor histidine kinase/response regulator [Nocardioides zeae]